MVIEMLLNGDIQKKIVQIILHFQKEINVIIYIIERKIKIIISFGQNFNKIWIFKVYAFIMFKIKYLINRMQCNTFSQQVWWLNGRGVCFHPRGQRFKLHKCCVCGQQW
jgi:hypothetical protein